jgi:hypothetical protein
MYHADNDFGYEPTSEDLAAYRATQATGPVNAHPFAHLGPAPYKLVGLFTLPSRSLLEANPEAYNRALREAPKVKAGIGTCAHCGTEIANVFIIQCSNGDRYGVGCDCILKVSEEPKLISAVKRVRNEMTAKRRRANEEVKIQEGLAWFEDHKADLAKLPHPNQWRNEKGDTYADYVAWVLQQSGNAGMLRMFRTAKNRLAESV